jgi:hypothetical protein
MLTKNKAPTNDQCTLFVGRARARARVGRACERAYINHDLNGRYLVMIPGRAVSRSFLTYPRIFAKAI